MSHLYHIIKMPSLLVPWIHSSDGRRKKEKWIENLGAVEY